MGKRRINRVPVTWQDRWKDETGVDPRRRYRTKTRKKATPLRWPKPPTKHWKHTWRRYPLRKIIKRKRFIELRVFKMPYKCFDRAVRVKMVEMTLSCGHLEIRQVCKAQIKSVYCMTCEKVK